MENDATMLTVTQTAAALGLNRNTVLRQITRGALHAKRLGSIWVVTPAEVERYRHTHLGKDGFASPDHPLHGRRTGGRRPTEGAASVTHAVDPPPIVRERVS